MSLDIAFSTEIDDYLDPDRAYDLYWSGLIKDKRGFICPGSSCSAQVTCANLDGDVQDMKMVPHFRVYGSHSPSCEIFRNIPLDLHYEDGASVKEEQRTIDEKQSLICEIAIFNKHYCDKKSTHAVAMGCYRCHLSV